MKRKQIILPEKTEKNINTLKRYQKVFHHELLKINKLLTKAIDSLKFLNEDRVDVMTDGIIAEIAYTEMHLQLLQYQLDFVVKLGKSIQKGGTK